MKILVIGDGKVGQAIIQHTCQEGHEITIIDNDSKVVEDIVNLYDVIGYVGNGASYDVQMQADVEKMDLVIAVTPSDETNILSCIVAKKLGAKSTIARVRNYDYNKQINLLMDNLGIDMTINPELEAANEIFRILNFPQAIKVDTFAKGNVDLVEYVIPENSPLIGESLMNLHSKYQVKVLISAVQRGEEVFIPTGSFTFKAKDRIHITSSVNNVRLFLSKLGLNEVKIRNILIIGGGKIALYLGEKLIQSKYKVKIIENDLQRCKELSDLLPQASIIYGDGTDQQILEEEGLASTDAVICLTGMDEENIIISLYANKMKVDKIIAKVNNSSFAQLLETVDVASIVTPKELISHRVVRFIRASNNSRGSEVITLYKLVNNRVEALEFLAKAGSKVLNIKLKDLKVKDKILIAGIIRNNEVIIPSGDDMILENDSVIVVTTNQFLDELTDILR